MASPLKVLFLGSGPIAAPVLTALAHADTVRIVGVVTQPDRPAGRKRILMPTPLGAAAIELGFDPIRVEDVNTPEFLERAAALAPEMLCVVSFGQILKQPLLDLPAIDCVNVHASLLPAYRGASPIAQAILNGDKATGVAFMQMERGLDSGKVYRMLTLPLDGSEYADALELRLGELAGAAAAETLNAIARGELTGTPQDPVQVTVCRKIAKAAGMIDWRKKSASEIERMTRAYFPWPGAQAAALLPGGKTAVLNCCKAAVRSDFSALAPGECANVPGRLVVGCKNHTALEILELIPSGGKRMPAAAFRNGLRGALPEFPEELPT